MTTDLATAPVLSDKERLKDLIVDRLRTLPDGRLEVENRFYQKTVHDLGLVGYSATKVRDALDSLGYEPEACRRVKRCPKSDSWAVIVYQLVM